MLAKIKKNKYFYIGFILVTISFFISIDIPFFWDGLSKSLRANWFYTHHYSQWVIPSEINSGHPPFWTLLLAFTWSIFGKYLWVSRVLLYILNIGVVYQLQQLIKQYKSPKIAWYWYLILFLEPTYLAQTTILNNDVLMLFMILLAINNINKSNVIYSLGLLGLLFCNLRGMLFFTGFFIYQFLDFVLNQHKNYKSIIKLISPYIIPFLSLALFFYYQYQTLGWFIKSNSGNWSGQRDLVGIKHLIHNLIATCWVFADFGRFFFWIVLIICLIGILKKNNTISSKNSQLLFLSSCLLLVNIVVMALSSNPIGHRYFMPFYLLGLLLFVNLLFNTSLKSKQIKLIVTLSSILLISGHFWIYPSKISQGWDSSLAYLNYFKIKKQMQQYVLNQHIDVNDICSKTRNPTLMTEYLKQGTQVRYQEENTIHKLSYFIHSNIENQTTDQEINTLKNDWLLVKQFKNKGIFIKLYKNPNSK